MAFYAMKTLGKNADNDLYLAGNHLAILQDADAQCAVIESILQTQQGELQFDEDAGIDYFGTILQSPRYIDFWAAQVRTKIGDLDFVSSVDDFTYEFDGPSSTLTWSMTVTNTNDERLDLINKKTAINGSPGIDVSWNDIYDKPKGVQDSLDMVEAMRNEAIDFHGTLDSRSTLRDTKDVVNRLLFDTSDPDYAKSRLITFSLVGVPLGTIIDFKRIRLDIKNSGTEEQPYYAPFIVEISDGTKVRVDDVSATGNTIVFSSTDDGGNVHHTTKHTLMKGGTITISLRGNFSSIWSGDDGETTEDESKIVTSPILINTVGKPFQYLSGIYIGKRVPLERIGNGTFYGCQNLKSIEWNQDEVDSIALGKYSFYGCSSIRTLTWIPKKLNSIDIGCFKQCSSITSMSGLETVSITTIPDECFEACTSLATLDNLPQTVTTLGDYSFFGCSSITKLEGLPDSITSFGKGCFGNCTSLSSILYPPSSLTTIGVDCFKYDSALESVYIGESVTEIGNGAFDGCANLNDILSEAENPPSINSNAFENTNIVIYVKPESVSSYTSDESNWKEYTIKKYGTYTFSLKNIPSETVLSSATSNLVSDSIWIINYGIGDKDQRFIHSTSTLPSFSYEEFHSNVDITIKGYVRRISSPSEENSPFISSESETGFKYLSAVSVTDSPLEVIGSYAFANCTGLESVDFGFADETRPYRIGEFAFLNCTSLTSTAWLASGLGTLEENGAILPAFGEGSFYGSGVVALEYDSTNVTSIPPYCFAETQIQSLHGIGGLGLLSLGDHCFFGCKKLVLIDTLAETGVRVLPDYCFADCSSLLELLGIQFICSEYNGEKTGIGVFENCTSLESINLLYSTSEITAITDYMFSGCTSLISLSGITNKIKSLGSYSFSGCSGLKSLRNLNEATSVDTIPDFCFSGCSGLKTLIGLYNVNEIGESAFENCTGLLSTSGLGAGLTSIGTHAFRNCPSLLYVTCISSSVPVLGENAFDSSMSSKPLYVLDGMNSQFSSADEWSKFINISSRTIQLVLENVLRIEQNGQAEYTKIISTIGPDEISGVWHVDYGDGSGIHTYYGEDTDTIEPHEFPSEGTYTLTLFGDITTIHGEEVTYNPDVHIVSSPDYHIPVHQFLGTLSSSTSSINISSQYLKEIGDFCFCNYGQSDFGGNDNSLSVSIVISSDGVVGACAFAKDDSHKNYGVIGLIDSFSPSTIGDYAFYQAGISSSTPFRSLKTCGTYAFANNDEIKELIGFESLESVSPYMFLNCIGLTTTTGLSNVETVGDYGFSGCLNIVTVKDFSASLSSIGEYAFRDCDKIKTVFVAISTPPQLAATGFTDTVFQTATLYVPADAIQAYHDHEVWGLFGDRIKSRSLNFVMTGVSAGQTLLGGTALVSANGAWAISYGDNEETVSYPAGTDVKIESYRFKSGTNAIKTIKISGPITSIKSSSDAYPIFCQTVGKNSKLESIESSEAMEIESFGDYLFSNCTALKTVIGAESIKSIGEYTFSGDISLTDISGLSGVISIGAHGFDGCSSLTNLYGLNSVTTVEERAFNGCSNLKQVDGFGTGISYIGDDAFASCTKISEVQIFAENPPTIIPTAFSGIDGTKVPLYVRTKNLSAYKLDSIWSTIFSNIRSRYVEFELSGCPSNMTVKGGVGKVCSDTFWVADWDTFYGDGIASKEGVETYLPEHLFTISGNHTIRLEGAITSISCDAPTIDGVSYPYDGIVPTGEESGFVGNSFMSLEAGGNNLEGDFHPLTRVSRSSWSVLTKVGDGTFIKNKNLSTSYLPGITEIGAAAFAFDTGLTNLTMLESVGLIDKFAFYGCSSLNCITGLNGNKTFPDKQLTIKDYAFADIPEITYIQLGIESPNDVLASPTAFGQYPIPTSTNLYVPIQSVTAYSAAPYWREFSVSSQVITFTLENVPSGTTIIGISGDNSVGTARVESTSPWTVDWDDGTIETMEKEITSFQSHTYTYDPNGDTMEAQKWSLVNGVYYRKKIEISITGGIVSLSCQSNTNSPFIATELNTGNPYLTKIVAPETMASIEVIGDYFVRGCSNLETISGFSHVKSIGQYAFQGCTALANIGDANSGFNSVTSIGNKAFADCQNLTSLASFSSLLNIGIRGFENCISLYGTTGMGSAYSDYSPSDWSSHGLSASFGAYAFDGCGFGAIDMMNYNVPPTIQTTTFPGDPSEVLVFVSSLSGVLNSYKTANVWSLYWNNLIASANITIQFDDGVITSPTRNEQGQITGGKAIYGINGRLAFAEAYVLIDWGDGTQTQSVVKESDKTTGWTFPNHLYTTDISGPVSINIRGNISMIYTGDANDTALAEGAYPDPLMKPFIGISTYEVDPLTGAYQITGTPDYSNKIIKLSFGRDSRLIKIGAYCFAHCNIGEIDIGKPVAWGEHNEHDGTLQIGDCAFWDCNETQIVTAIGSADKGYPISAVGHSSFEGCVRLNNVEFLNGVKSIGISAFKNCIGLTNINLPSTLLSVCQSAFEGCYNITNGITWEQSTEQEVINNRNITIKSRAFYGCLGANNAEWPLVIPSQVHIIEDGAFYGCGMKSLTWGSSVYTSSVEYSLSDAALGNRQPGVFEGCQNLNSVTILHTLSKIPSRCFCDCNNLVTINEISGLTTIGAYSFFGCENLSDTSFHNIIANATGTIGNYSFARCFSLNDIEIPSTVTALGEGCFCRSSMYYLTGSFMGLIDGNESSSDSSSDVIIDIPSFISVNDFESWMTSNYGSLRMDVWNVYDNILKYDDTTSYSDFKVSWDAESGSIGAACFMGCKGLNNSIWNNFPSITQIPAYCFYNCQLLFYGNNLSVLPSTITNFGRFALARTGMTGLGRFTGEYDENTGYPVFAPPLSASLAPALFLGCSNLVSLGETTELVFDNENSSGNEESVYFTDGISRLLSTVPSSLPDSCFYGCTSLEDINALESDVPSIVSLGKYCFARCTALSGRGYKSIFEALANIVNIGDGCFLGCTGIDVFTGLPLVTFYPYQAFYGCTGISEISGFATDNSSTIVLSGDSFGGNPNISSIDVSDYTHIVETFISSGTNEDGAFSISDPFTGIAWIDDKRNAFVKVFPDLFVQYMGNNYWKNFHVTTETSGNQIISMSISIPSGGGTLTIPRTAFTIPTGGKVTILWGDGTSEAISSSLINEISHTYTTSGNIRLSIYGDITGIKGKITNNEVTDPSGGYDWIAVPFIYSDLVDKIIGSTTYQEGVNTLVTEINILEDIKIGEAAFANFTEMETVITPSSISQTTLGSCTFIRCRSLTTIKDSNESAPEMPNVSSIGTACFMESGIRNLDFLVNTSVLKTLGLQCFSHCNQLENILNIPSTITTLTRGRQFYLCDKLTSLDGLQNTKIQSTGSATFARTGITSIEHLPQTVKTINNLCFAYTPITDLNGLDNKGTGEFEEHTAMSSVTTIGEQAFIFCTGLTDISAFGITGMREVRRRMFFGCSGLTSLNLGSNNITSIGEECFAECSSMPDTARFPSSVITLGKGCFRNCTNLSSPAIITGTSISNLPEGCFEGCANMQNLSGLTNGIQSIGIGCFKNCIRLQTLTGSNDGTGLEYTSITSLPKDCFNGCSELINIVAVGKPFPATITYIGEGCFQGCGNLYNIYVGRWIDNSITELGANVFDYSAIGNSAVVHVPSGSEEAYRSASGWSNFTNIQSS